MWMCEIDRRAIRIFMPNLREVFQGRGCCINCCSFAGNSCGETQILQTSAVCHFTNANDASSPSALQVFITLHQDNGNFDRSIDADTQNHDCRKARPLFLDIYV